MNLSAKQVVNSLLRKHVIGYNENEHVITAPFNNNMRTLKFKCVFATVNQMFDGSSQLPTTTECAVIKLLCTVQTTKQCSAVVVAGRTPRTFDDGREKRICRSKFEFQSPHVIEKDSNLIFFNSSNLLELTAGRNTKAR